ncbi:hypothetical protein EDD16DRAFT_1537291 [Pisolithus croceorrhizus]|nr:hypothetical protein EDD16DRAFT_1537291 [Pisolithus croceorrhizus]
MVSLSELYDLSVVLVRCRLFIEFLLGRLLMAYRLTPGIVGRLSPDHRSCESSYGHITVDKGIPCIEIMDSLKKVPFEVMEGGPSSCANPYTNPKLHNVPQEHEMSYINHTLAETNSIRLSQTVQQHPKIALAMRPSCCTIHWTSSVVTRRGFWTGNEPKPHALPRRHCLDIYLRVPLIGTLGGGVPQLNSFGDSYLCNPDKAIQRLCHEEWVTKVSVIFDGMYFSHPV